ncbi:hypothetical protein DPMN_112959 [Dreissena polymorpha]|uniref:Uncharacterized protein n=1 Tax=Dreissena polymorpha TaxID=45954 RepID=A0A9D4KGM0_DREPO|nr:hypothetical protein DPMN_112959 [Dreissena polymorpha]
MVHTVALATGPTSQLDAKQLPAQCFYEGRWFPANSIINVGRSYTWCYGTFCSASGQVQHWDNYNCPLPDRFNPQPPFPVYQPPATSVPIQTSRRGKSDSLYQNHPAYGCYFRRKVYSPGTDILNRKIGQYCLGIYCDWHSNIRTWRDSCANVDRQEI